MRFFVFFFNSYSLKRLSWQQQKQVWPQYFLFMCLECLISIVWSFIKFLFIDFWRRIPLRLNRGFIVYVFPKQFLHYLFWNSDITCIVYLFVCLIYITFCQLWTYWTSQREGSGYLGTRAMPYSFSNEPSGSFTCPVYSTYTRNLGLNSHPNDMVRQGIELTTPGFTV